ncbi:hypothetical protein RFI_08835 [Reticulomyxa filosa]|uniref:Uncharacterized protein n=1 Tax=Reticulomyxa filosa TaxID=46433 RepID=X6NQV1_RETFI|nr:hypothetical protein RFI_08835 [Reticulomyxa filosa]|eukprot:ETO28298.1 hypothetical protein RFI_08835 [Reticulomyxa filosa]
MRICKFNNLKSIFLISGCLFFVVGWLFSTNSISTSLLLSPLSTGSHSDLFSTSSDVTKEEGDEDDDNDGNDDEQEKELKDWFDAEQWSTYTNDERGLEDSLRTCPHWEDICVYDGHFRVNSELEEFALNYSHWDLLGQLVDISPIVRASNKVYQKFFIGKMESIE